MKIISYSNISRYPRRYFCSEVFLRRQNVISAGSFLIIFKPHSFAANDATITQPTLWSSSVAWIDARVASGRF